MSDKITFLDKIISSDFFKKSLVKGEQVLLNDKLRLLKLLKEALVKVNQIAVNNNITVVKLMNHYVITFSAMIKAYISGEYKKIPLKTVVKIVAVLIYFISPFDFIPDVLPLVGFTDDLALLIWVAKSIKNELDEFDKLNEYK